MTIPTKEHAIKILELLEHGLVDGLGIQEPGRMCVEAAVLGEPHNDSPSCVGQEVRKYKISLNDSSWPSNTARAEGMKRLAIAQLGSFDIDQVEFNQQIFIQTQKDIIPLTFDWIPEDKRMPEHAELKEFCRVEFDLKKLQEKFKNYHYKYYYYNNYYDKYYNYYYNYYYLKIPAENLHKLLKLSAEVAVKVLCNMKCKGCEWLDLIPKT